MRACCTASSPWLFGMLTLLICVDIVFRRFGIASMPWLVEVIEYVMYGGTFFGGALGLAARRARARRSGAVVRPQGGRHPPRAARRQSGLRRVGGDVLVRRRGRALDAYRANFIQYKNLAVHDWVLLLPNSDRMRDACDRVFALRGYARVRGAVEETHIPIRSSRRAAVTDHGLVFGARPGMVGSICVLMTLGVPIAFAFFITNLVGAVIFLGGRRRHRCLHPGIDVGDRQFQSGADPVLSF